MDIAVDGKSTGQEGLEPLFILEEGDNIDSVMCNITKVNSQETVKISQEDNGDTIKENTQATEKRQQEESNVFESENRTLIKSEVHEEEMGDDPEKRTQMESRTKDIEAVDIDVNRENETTERAEENVPDEPPSVGEGASPTQIAPPEIGTKAQTKTEVLLRPKTQPSAATSAKFLSPEDAQKKVSLNIQNHRHVIYSSIDLMIW